MLEDAMAKNLDGVSPVAISGQETAGGEDWKSIIRFIRQNGLVSEEVTPVVMTVVLPTGNNTGPQYLD